MTRQYEAELEAQLSEKNRYIERLEQQVQSGREYAEEMESRLKAARKQALELEAKVARLEASKELQQQLIEQQSALVKQMRDTTDRDVETIDELRGEVDTLRTRLNARPPLGAFRMDQHLIAELLTAARNELAMAISYRAADVICDGEGWDSTEAAVAETCDPCRKRALREVGVLASILHPLDHLLDEYANQLGKPIPQRWVELPAGVEGYEEQRERVTDAWDRTMAGTDLWFDRRGFD